VRGRVVKAFLVLRASVEPNEALKADIQEFAKAQMAGYKYPRKIEFMAALPKTASGKIKRKELRNRECGSGEQDATS
jgi:acyl-coenzyme A synthetase/AMP-(fatty) acid ligase